LVTLSASASDWAWDTGRAATNAAKQANETLKNMGSLGLSAPRHLELEVAELRVRLSLGSLAKVQEIALGGSFMGFLFVNIKLAPTTKKCSAKPAKTEHFPAKGWK
jgi:hypothetical protein